MPTDPIVRVLAAVALRGNRYLVGRRPAHKRHGGLWEFPGGKLEPGESDEDGLRRELREELDLTLEGIGRHLFSIVDPASGFRIDFMEVGICGEPRCIEHQEIAWLSVAQLHILPLAPSDEAFVDDVLKVSGAYR
jgi:mutator protein MutT